MNNTNTKFYHYSQNNTGGSFSFNESDGITHHVIIEAKNYKEANHIAERIGLYFDGYGDCDCCGNRWYEQWQEDGSDEPSIYGESIKKFSPSHHWMPDGKEGAVHYLDGRIEWFGSAPKKARKVRK